MDLVALNSELESQKPFLHPGELDSWGLDAIGAVAAKNFININGPASIRYQSAAPGILGIRAGGPAATVVTSWRELP